MQLAGTLRSLPLSAGHVGGLQKQSEIKEPLSAAFFWLTVFCFLYCARPEDVIAPLRGLPLAKLSAALAVFSIFLSSGKLPRPLKDLPREAWYLFALIFLLLVSALLSPIWRGGAFGVVLDFSKVCIAWVLIFLSVT